MRKQMTYLLNAVAIRQHYIHGGIMKFANISMMALIACGLTLTGCDKGKTEKPESSQVTRFFWSEKANPTEAQIHIINQFGEPVQGAQILIGDAQGSPFRNNFFTTDKLGRAVIPTEWTAPASVTVDAAGYIRQTILNVEPGDLTLKMSTAYLAQRAEVRGQVTQMPVVNGDKLIDFALVMPAVAKADLLNFDISQVISPYNDTLTAAGQTSDIPSNVSLPKQSESYFINVTLDKPVYRLKVTTLGQKKFVTTRGRFVFKTVVGELRNGKPFAELINYFSILGGSIREATLTSALTNLDIPGNEMEFKSTLSVNSVNTPADELMLVLATNEFGGSMVPTDVKRTTNGQPTKLQSMLGKPAYIVSFLKKQSEFMALGPGADRMSASMLPYSATAQRLLPLIANPTIATSGNFVITLPAPPVTTGINAIATSATISDLVETQDAGKTILIPNRKWEVIGLGWSQQINLPKWPLDNTTSRKRVEVNYIGSTSNKVTRLDNSLIENATHITHASTDF